MTPIENAPWIKRGAIEEKADALRELAGRRTAPISPLVIAKSQGIEVFDVTFEDAAISGMLRRSSSESYEILVNRDEPPMRMRFTIAHELGHYVLHRNLQMSFVDKEIDFYRREADGDDPVAIRVEVQANMFAAALLMPKQLVREALKVSLDTAVLAEIFLVSEMAMRYRIANLGLT